MSITRYRVKNRYFVASVLLLTFGLAISWFFASNLFEILTMDYDAPDLVNQNPKEVKALLVWQILSWESIVSSSMYYLFNFIPVLFILPTLALFDEKRSYLVFGKNRIKSFTKNVYLSVLSYVMLSSFGVVLSFLTFYSIAGLFAHRDLENIGGFSAAFPENFYENHPYLFFIIMVCTVYFLLAVSFSLISCGLVLLMEKEYQVVAAVLFIHLIYLNVGRFLNIQLFNISTSFIAFNTTATTFEVFQPIILLLIVGGVLTYMGVNKVVRGF